MNQEGTLQLRNKTQKAGGKAGDMRLAGVKNPLVRCFAVRLLNWRKAEGRTLKEVAAELGLSISIICEWEHGRRFPSVDHLQALAQYTGIPAWCFLRESKGKGQS